jgi:hypothetical protein
MFVYNVAITDDTKHHIDVGMLVFIYGWNNLVIVQDTKYSEMRDIS